MQDGMALNRFMGDVRKGARLFSGQPGRTSWANQERYLRAAPAGADNSYTWENSAIGACINWAGNTFPDARFTVRRPSAEGPQEVVGHSLTTLMLNPNPMYTEFELWASTLLSLMVDGNAYWRIVRNGIGAPRELYYIPHWMIEPRWLQDGSQYIGWYEYRVDGVTQEPIAKEDIVQFRWGALDPLNTRKSVSPARPILREYLTDNEAAVFSHAVLRNWGVMSRIISPKTADAVFSDPQMQELKAAFDSFAGDQRGKVAVMNSPVGIESVESSPERMALDKIRTIPEERICAAYNLPASVVGLGQLRNSPTYSNLEGYTKLAWNQFLRPLQRKMAAQMGVALLPQMLGSRPTDEPYFDVSGVSALAEDVNAKRETFREDLLAGAIKRSEFRAEFGYEVGPEDDLYMTDLQYGVSPVDAAKRLLVRDAKKHAREAREQQES